MILLFPFVDDVSDPTVQRCDAPVLCAQQCNTVKRIFSLTI